MELLGDLPAVGEDWHELRSVEADRAQIVTGDHNELLVACLHRHDLQLW
jgi:hypothetical protein